MTLKHFIALTILLLTTQARSHRQNTSIQSPMLRQQCQKLFDGVSASEDKRVIYDRLSGGITKPPFENYESAFSLIDGMINGTSGNRNGLLRSRPQAEIINLCIPKIKEIYDKHRADMATAIAVSSEAEASAESTTPEGDPHENGNTQSVSACNVQLFSTEECSAYPGDWTDFYSLMRGFGQQTKVVRFSADDCSCAEDKFKKDRGTRTALEMDRAKENLRKKINETLLKSYGKKFINDYAANLEDLNYFLNEKSTVFETDITSAPGVKINEGLKYQCNQEEAYQAKIEAACKNSNVSLEEREKRKKTLISAWGDTPAQNFNEHMLKIGEDVLTLKSKTNSSLKGAPYSRALYDAFRATQNQQLPSVILADKITATILSNPILLEKFKAIAPTKSVQEALIDVVAGEVTKPDSVFNILMEDPKIADTRFIRDLKVNVTNEVKKDIKAVLSASFNQAVSNHPGFELLMNDKDKLNEFSLSPSDKSIIFRLEAEKAGGFLDQKFREKCDNLQNEFAKVVCSNPEKLMANFKPEEIDDAISHENPSLIEDTNIYNKLICENISQNAPIALSPFHLPRNQKSDYLARLKNPLNPRDRFSIHMRNVTENPKSAVATFISESIDERLSGQGLGTDRVTMNDNRRIGNQFSSQVSGTDSIEPSFAKSQADLTKSNDPGKSNPISGNLREEISNEVPLQNNFIASPVQSLSGAIIPPSSDKSSEVLKKDDRTELRDSLIDENNKEQVEKLISNIDDSSARELLKLREQTLEEKMKLLKLTSGTEQAKLKELEKRMKDLNQERSIASTSEFNEAEPAQSYKTKKSKLKGVGREIDSFEESLNNSSSLQNTSGNNGTIGSNSSESLSAGQAGLNSDFRSGTNASKLSFNNVGGLVVSSNTTLAQGQELKPQELNNELYKFLTQNEPDISTLMNIKTSGMVYKFKILENGVFVEKEIMIDYLSLNEDVKKLIDQKITKSKGNKRSVASIDEELAQVKRTHAYLALKLIIAEQIRK